MLKRLSFSLCFLLASATLACAALDYDAIPGKVSLINRFIQKAQEANYQKAEKISTECIVPRVIENPNLRWYVDSGRLGDLVMDVAIEPCNEMLRKMIEAYEAIRGPKSGEAFFDLYLDDIYQTIDERMKQPPGQ